MVNLKYIKLINIEEAFKRTKYNGRDDLDYSIAIEVIEKYCNKRNIKLEILNDP